jgi:hypothetical protein
MDRSRLSIRRTRIVSAAALSPDERADIARRAFDIVSQTFHGVDRELFASRAVFRAPDARIALFYGASGELAGFSSAAVMRIESGGVQHSVYDAGVYFDLRYATRVAAQRRASA